MEAHERERKTEMIRVVCVGDNFIDRYQYKGVMYPGGNCVNFAVYASMLGHQSEYVGTFGDDPYADMIRDALDAFHIGRDRCRVIPGGETGLGSIRLIDGDRVITDDNDWGCTRTDPVIIDSDLQKYLKGFDLIVSAYCANLEDQLVRLAETGVPLAYDFNEFWDEDKLRKLCPCVEIALLSGADRNESELQIAMQTAHDSGSGIVICTIGARGAIVYDGKEEYRIAPYNQGSPIIDTMGAGDSFFAGFATAYIDGMVRMGRLIGEDPAKYTNGEDRRAFREALIRFSMHCGDLMAMKTCMVEGSFGRGVPIR